MTRRGVLNKSILLLSLTLFSASLTWGIILRGINPISYAWGGALLGFSMAMMANLKPNWSPYIAPIYSLLEGMFLGSVSTIINAYFPVLPLQAVFFTFFTFIFMLSLYRMDIIQVTEKFRFVIFGATMALATYYFIAWIGSWFHVMPFHVSRSWLSIAFNIFLIIMAASNFIINFDFIERRLIQRAPKHIEWFAAMALIITLIWLYVEILNFLLKMNKND